MIYPTAANIVHRKMPQLTTSTSAIHSSVSYPLYVDIDHRSMSSDETKFQLDNYEKLSNRKGQQQQKFDLNIFYENLFGNQNSLYRHHSHSPLFSNESTLNYRLNKICVKNDKQQQQQSFSIDAILGFATNNKEIIGNEFYGPNHHHQTMLSGSNRFDAFIHQVYDKTSQKQQQPSPPTTTIHYPAIKKANHFTNSQEDLLHQVPTTLKSCHISKSKNKISANKKSLKHHSSLSKSNNLINNMMTNDGGVAGNGSNAKSKRVRTIFTPEQLERLETEFEKQQYMVGTGRLYLASTLNLTEAQVKVWFQNRRIKWRKQHLEGYQDGIDNNNNNNDNNNSNQDQQINNQLNNSNDKTTSNSNTAAYNLR